MFEYKAEARERGIKDAGVGLLLCAVTGGFLWAIYQGAGMVLAWWVFGFALAIFFVAGLVFVVGGLARIISGGCWEMRVDGNGVSWQAPFVAEPSFAYAREQIASVEKRIRRKTRSDGSIKEKQDYFLVARDGDEHRLVNQSGIDVDAFVAACERLGIAIKERVVPYRKRKDL